MTAIDEPRTLAERYTIAADGTYATDEAMLIAAGWCHNGLGVLLMRLKGEFDSVKAEMHGPGQLNQTEALLILSHLKSLNQTREAFGQLARQRATIERFMQPDRVVDLLAGRVLVAYLDPNCHHCDGVGTRGGYGEPQMLCRACGGSSKARTTVGRSDAERVFAAHLLGLIERAASEAERAIGGKLRQANEVRKMVGEVKA